MSSDPCFRKKLICYLYLQLIYKLGVFTTRNFQGISFSLSKIMDFHEILSVGFKETFEIWFLNLNCLFLKTFFIWFFYVAKRWSISNEHIHMYTCIHVYSRLSRKFLFKKSIEMMTIEVIIFRGDNIQQKRVADIIL